VTALPFSKNLDGWTSSLIPREGTFVDVVYARPAAREVVIASFDAGALSAPATTRVISDRFGPTVATRSSSGSLFVLTRGEGRSALSETSGVWLLAIPPGGGAPSRTLLERGVGRDPWIDLAVLPDGRPVVVWTSAPDRSLGAYMPAPSP
jgi:hypothetical protein